MRRFSTFLHASASNVPFRWIMSASPRRNYPRLRKLSEAKLQQIMAIDWRGIREVPRSEEIMAREPPPLPELHNVLTGSKENYLRAHYLLHRYEATEVLRQAVNVYRKNPLLCDAKMVKVYRGVYASAYVVSPLRIACRLTFSTPKNEDETGLGKPEDITPGSLVVLSPHEDEFRTKCFVGTVAPIPEDPEDADYNGATTDESVIDLLWADASDVVLDPKQKLIMLEPRSGYFESLRYTMTALQRSVALEHTIDKYLYEPHDEIKTEPHDPIKPAQHLKETPNNDEIKPAPYLKETPNNEVEYPQRAKELDESQFEALKMAANQELAIVQGPPGTGKTFTSIVAIETVLKTLQASHLNRMSSVSDYMPPIVIAAQTNHAVDQILLKCKNLGIGNIARLGGRSDNEVILESTLFSLRKRYNFSFSGGAEEQKARQLQREIRKIMTDFSLLKADQLRQFDVISSEQYDSLIKDDEWETAETDSGVEKQQPLPMHRWLDEYRQQPEFRRAEQDIPQEAELHPSLRRKRRNQKFHHMKVDHLESTIRAMHCDKGGTWYDRAERLLSKTANLYHIKPADRGAVYCYLHKQLSSRLTRRLGEIIQDHAANGKNLLLARRQDDVRAIRRERVKILGCTTTGILKHWDLFDRLKPRVLLIEEAAETREANIVAALTPSIEQLILVGDHQQLTPRADLPELCRWPNRLDYSLFERFVNREFPYCSLQVQRRMVPELREVIQTFYPKLRDHPTVNSLERQKPIPGMHDCRLWWFDHMWTQHRGASGYAFSNPKEAKMIVQFTKYLVRSGVPPEEISILTYYSGQRELIKAELARENVISYSDCYNPDFEWSVRTIDDFQGEENEIIILSLVRGPDVDGQRAKPGFLANENRAVVANSRARQGFFIFGNAQNVLQPSNCVVWRKIHKAFGKRTGTYLPVTCTAHGTAFKVSEPSDWGKLLPSGCSPGCRGRPLLTQAAKALWTSPTALAQNAASRQNSPPKTTKQVGMKSPQMSPPRSPPRSREASVTRMAGTQSPQRSSSISYEESITQKIKNGAGPAITSSQTWGWSTTKTPKQAGKKSPQRSPPSSREASVTRKDRNGAGKTPSQKSSESTRAPEKRPTRYTSDQILEKGMRNMFAAGDGQEATERAMSATSSGPTITSPESDSDDLIQF